MNNKVVDIVIPTYKPDGKLELLLKRLGRQSYAIRHILIINTKSDRFPIGIERFPGTKIIQIEPWEFDHGATRHYGMNMSDAEIVICMTQDAVPADGYLVESLVQALEPAEVAVAYAKQQPDKECDAIERYTRSFNYPETSRIKGKEDIAQLGIKTFFCSNVCAAYKKDIYELMGGFTKRTIFNEDMILAGQMIYANYKVCYCSEAKVIHSHNYSGIEQFHRNFDLAVSQVDNPTIFSGIPSESEGLRLVKTTAQYLVKSKKAYLIPKLIYKSGCKYMGYKMGQNYKHLPLWLVKKCSMNTKYWGKSKVSQE